MRLALALLTLCVLVACDGADRRAPSSAAATPPPAAPSKPDPAATWPPPASTAEPGATAEPEGAATSSPEAAESAAAADGDGPLMIPTNGLALEDAIRHTKARAILVNVWASWCGSCKQEMPMLRTIARDFAGHGVHLLLLSADEPDKSKEARAFLEEHGFEVPGRIMDGPLSEMKLSLHPKWSGAIPATFLFDGDADLAYYWAGPVRADELLPVLADFLAGKDVQGSSVPRLGRVGG